MLTQVPSPEGYTGLQTGPIGLQTGPIGLQTGPIGLQTGSIGLQKGSKGLQTVSIGLQAASQAVLTQAPPGGSPSSGPHPCSACSPHRTVHPRKSAAPPPLPLSLQREHR